MNKKGDVPIIVLVIGVFAVCTLALISFYSSNTKVSNSFEGIGLMDKINVKIEEVSFYEKAGVDSSIVLENFELDDEISFEEGCFVVSKFKTRVRPKFSLDWTEKVFVFSVKYCAP